MANHKSCRKKQNVIERRRKENLDRVQRCKANIKKLKKETDKNKAIELFNTINKQLDQIGSKHIFHKNKVARIKSKYNKLINSIQ